MHIHILGICGTFMGGLAVLGSELNLKITGSDQNVYPPMSTQLNDLGIQISAGFDSVEPLNLKPDYILVGNVMSRGKPVIEEILNRGLPILSGPEWLSRFVLRDRHVIAISGTHGKTTTTSMVAWILEYAGLNPGFLIGGVPNNFARSARLGTGPFFVVEADEYDSAFFDKRSKFVHYWPNTLIINNIEFDHADIFPDLAAIQLQFHHLVRTVPGKGLIIYPKTDKNVLEVLKKGSWSPCVSFGGVGEQGSSDQEGWLAKNYTPSNNQFEVYFKGKNFGKLQWNCLGQHNVQNALAAIAAAYHVGIDPKIAIEALSQFQGVKRRMEVKGIKAGITVYDDFAHHPTAIQTTLEGLRAKVGRDARIVAVLDIRSNTMKAGHHQNLLAGAVRDASAVYIYQSSDIPWDVNKVWKDSNKPGGVYSDTETLLEKILEETNEKDHVIFMSNGGFNGIQTQYLERLPSHN